MKRQLPVGLYRYQATSQHKLTLFVDKVSAGFPSPAQDYVEQTLDLNELCVKRPASTFFLRVQGDSMRDAAIFPNDMLVVDRAINAEQGDIVVAALNGEFTVKELRLLPSPQLIPHNDQYSPIDIRDGDELEIFGVVAHVIRHISHK